MHHSFNILTARRLKYRFVFHEGRKDMLQNRVYIFSRPCLFITYQLNFRFNSPLIFFPHSLCGTGEIILFPRTLLIRFLVRKLRILKHVAIFTLEPISSPFLPITHSLIFFFRCRQIEIACALIVLFPLQSHLWAGWSKLSCAEAFGVAYICSDIRSAHKCIHTNRSMWILKKNQKRGKWRSVGYFSLSMTA